MDQLLFYSIPGYVFLMIIFAFYPNLFFIKGATSLLLIGIPFMGFVIHQVFRLFFQITGDYARKDHEVISDILNNVSVKAGINLKTRDDAFHVWDITVFNESIFNGFREHNARAWHFAMGIWTTFSISSLGFILAFFNAIINNEPITGVFSVFFSILTGILYLCGRHIINFINKQETTFLLRNEEKFIESIKKIYGNSIQPQLLPKPKSNGFLIFFGLNKTNK